MESDMVNGIIAQSANTKRRTAMATIAMTVILREYLHATAALSASS